MAINTIQRRQFLKNTVLTGAGLLAATTVSKTALSQNDSGSKIFVPMVATGQETLHEQPSQPFLEMSIEEGAKRPDNPEVFRIAEDTLNALKYSIASAASQPDAAFARGSVESELQDAMRGLNPDKAVTIQNSAKALVNADMAVREVIFGRYGTLSLDEVHTLGFSSLNGALPDLNVDIQSLGISDSELGSGNVLDANPDHLADIWGVKYTEDVFAAQAKVGSSNVTDKLGFYINRIKCLDETNPEWPGKDDIALGAVTVDENGDTKKISEQFIGHFNDGSTKHYNPDWRYTWFNLREQHEFTGSIWPKKYGVTLALAEKDNGGFASFLNNLWERVRDKVKAEIAKAVGQALTPYLGSAISAAIGQATAWVIDRLVGWLINLFKDDIFRPVTLSCTVPSYNARWTLDGKWGSTSSGLRYAYFSSHGGRYYVEYYWQLFA